MVYVSIFIIIPYHSTITFLCVLNIFNKRNKVLFETDWYYQKWSEITFFDS